MLLWNLKGVVPFPFKVISRNHSHTIRIGRSKVVATRSTTADDLNLWVWSQSHKQGVCVKQIQDRRVSGVGVTHGHVSKFYLRCFRYRV